MKKIWFERIFSIFLMILAIGAFWQTFSFPKSPTGLITGPAFFPAWLSILLFSCSAFLLIKTFIRPDEGIQEKVIESYRVLLRILYFFLLICAILLIIPYTGLLPAQFILVFILEISIEKRRYKHAFLVSMSACAVIYLIFEIGLQIRLPRSIIFE